MALSAADQLAVWTDFIDRQPGVTAKYTAADLKAAAVAVDTWITNNQAAFLTALASGAPVFNSNSTAAQKTLMFVEVLLRRQGMI